MLTLALAVSFVTRLPPFSRLVGSGMVELAFSVRIQRRPVRAAGLRERQVLQLRVEPLDGQLDVVVERHLDGLFHRQLDDGPRLRALLQRLLLRRDGLRLAFRELLPGVFHQFVDASLLAGCGSPGLRLGECAGAGSRAQAPRCPR